jgi:hypothetical protein
MALIVRIRSWLGVFLAALLFLARALALPFRQRPIKLRRVGRGPAFLLLPDGRVLPAISGADDDDDDDDDKDKDDDADDDDADDDDEPVKKDDDWQAKSRKNEGRYKREKRKREKLEKDAEERESADKTDQEKAVDEAKKAGREEAEKKALEERKADRLESASIRLASKGLTIGEGDDAETVRFADPDDAHLHVERAIRRGEIDTDDIFDDEGKVDSDALQSELEKLLERKPHLKAGETEGSGGKGSGDPDTRKGGPAKNDLEGMSPEDHAKRKYPAGDKK